MDIIVTIIIINKDDSGLCMMTFSKNAHYISRSHHHHHHHIHYRHHITITDIIIHGCAQA